MHNISAQTEGRRKSNILKSYNSFFRMNVLFLLSLLMLCLSFTGFCSKAYALSIEQETMMGQAFLQQIQAYFEVVDDDFAHRYINAMGQYLVRPLETKPFPF